jgi:hypothetical protein
LCREHRVDVRRGERVLQTTVVVSTPVRSVVVVHGRMFGRPAVNRYRVGMFGDRM